jgi:WD40 repeat protein/serine/threonine protein kinase
MDEASIFLEALKKPSPGERTAFLDRACGSNDELRRSVELLLRAHDKAGGFLADSPAPAGVTLDQPITESPGTVIGPYKLLEQIGEGGMGTVWMAQQVEPVKRLVAVKLVKAGMDSKQVIARFEAEWQALALMDHPNIARVLDAGTTAAGRPYFVMDLVRGVPITRYCDEHKLTPRQRLQLFVPVCQAVQHAHAKGVIHRDLKPSNVLIALYDGKPVPKVIDFGVAKAAGQQLTDKTLVTGFGAIVGTLEYMSPEQAELNNQDIDTRSDIYSLGVLLYELLTGGPPLTRQELEKAGMLEMLRMIREQEPTKPSSKLSMAEGLPTLAANRGTEPAKLTKLIRGELDWIVMKALEKDRNRRYETANGFAMDVQRYLADEPVLACPPSAGYRLRKFARRNKGPVVAITVISLCLVVGIVGTSWGLVRARQAEGKARTEADTAVAERQRANQEAEKAKRERRIERLRFYASQINLAHQALQTGEHTRAIQILDELRPQAGQEDLRTFEWYYLWRICHYRCRGVLRGHENTITSLAFLPDKRTLVSGSRDGTVRLWDWEGGKEVRRFQEKVDCSSLAISRDGARLAAGSHEGFITCWDLKTRKVCRRLDVGAAVRTVAFSPDGRFLVSGDDSKFLRVWNLSTGKEAASQAVTDHVISVAVSAQGRAIATADWNEVILWSWDGQQLTRGKNLDVGGAGPPVTFSSDGQFLAIGHLFLTVFELETLKQQTVDPIQHGGRRAIAFSPNGEHLAVGGDDRAVRIFHVKSGAEILQLPHLRPVHSVAFSIDGRMLAASGEDREIKLWDLRFRPTDQSLDVSTDLVGYGRTCLTFTPDGNALVAGGIWDYRMLLKLADPPEAVRVFALSSDGKTLAYTASEEPLVKIWDVTAQREIATLKGHKGTLWHCAFSPDASTLITCEEGEGATRFGARQPTDSPNIIRWNLQSRFGTHLNPGYPVRRVTFSPDGKTMVTGGYHSSVTLWDVATWLPRFRLQHGDGWVEGLAFSPDGGTLAVSESTGFIKLYEVATWRVRAVLRNHTRWVWGLAFSPDSRTLATGSHDRTISFWDVETGQERMTIRGLRGLVWATAFSPDGKTLASLSQDGVVQLWPAAIDESDFAKSAVGTLQDFLKAVEARPDDLELLRRIAGFYLGHGCSREAAAVYDRAIERSPTNATLKARRDQLQPGVVAVWNFDAGPEGWGSPHECSLAVSDGVLHIRTTGGDPWVILPVAAPAGWKELTLHVRTDRECQAQLFWATEPTADFAEERSVLFTVKPGRAGWAQVKVRFRADSALTALRLDPVDRPEGEVRWEVDAATLAHVDPPPE